MSPSSRLTKDTYERLSSELEDLRTRGRIEIAKAIEAARALGDLSENGDYHAAKDTQGKMEARIRQLEAMLKEPEIVEGAGQDGAVDVGAVVSLRFDGDDEPEGFFFGSIEEAREGLTVVSPESPLGLALAGHRRGDRVRYRPRGDDGPELEVEIVTVGD